MHLQQMVNMVLQTSCNLKIFRGGAIVSNELIRYNKIITLTRPSSVFAVSASAS